MSGALGKFVGNVCQNLTGGSARVPVSRVFAALPPADGSLQLNADGTGSYFCPQQQSTPSRSVNLKGKLKLCEAEPALAEVQLACGAAQLTITMGDNGSALDDIFEVAVDGRTVLTSSQPVTSTSTVLSLPKGRTTVTMRGLAASDGIGTYFISFAGATVISGATSGTDLTPGVVKTFVIEVL